MGRGKGAGVQKKAGSRHATGKGGRKTGIPCKKRMTESATSIGVECFGCHDLIAEPCQLCGLHYTCKHCTETCPCEKFFETHCRHCREEVSESCTIGFCDTCIEVEKVCPKCWITGGGSHDTSGTECSGNGRECRKCYHDAVAQGCSETETCRVCYVKYRDEMSNSCRYCKNAMRCMPGPFWFEDCHECTVCRSTFDLNSQEGGGPYDPSKCWVQKHQLPCVSCGGLLYPTPVHERKFPECEACARIRRSWDFSRCRVSSLAYIALKASYDAEIDFELPFDLSMLCPSIKKDFTGIFPKTLLSHIS